MEEDWDDGLSAEARELRRIADVMEGDYRERGGELRPFLRRLGISADPKEAREKERADREREQAKLYRLVVLIAAISALASIASVVVTVVNA